MSLVGLPAGKYNDQDEDVIFDEIFVVYVTIPSFIIFKYEDRRLITIGKGAHRP